MAKAPAPPKGGRLDLGRKVGPLPLWGWGAVAGAAWYLYSRNQPGAEIESGAAAGADYFDTGAGYGGGGFYGGGGGGGFDGGSGLPPIAPESPLPAEPPLVEPPLGAEPPLEDIGPPGPIIDDTPRRPPRRHDLERLRKRQKALKARIERLREGGVTPAERRKLIRLRRRRRTIRQRIRRRRRPRRAQRRRR